MNQASNLRLLRGEERRLRQGHLWVFSNEVDTRATPLKGLQPGQLVTVIDSKDAVLGLAYVNPNALICARLLSRRADVVIDTAWFERRLRRALALRERLYARPFYRLVHAEGDGLPGLIVDRYGDYLSVQFTTAGIESRRSQVLETLQQVLAPRGMVLRNDGALRTLEGLPQTVEVLGEVPDSVLVEEEGVPFAVSLTSGQKTGWFYDQRDNRSRLLRYLRKAGTPLRVLDVCSYVGAWSVRAALTGAAVTAVDSSASALAAAHTNAERNGVPLATHEGDALEVLKSLRDARAQFDVVVIDPPALIKRKKDFEAGREHYARLNHLALELLPSDGLLVSCSCSHHLPTEELQRLVQREARRLRRDLQLLEQGAAAPDHPVHPAIPETAYLKALWFRVSDNA